MTRRLLRTMSLFCRLLAAGGCAALVSGCSGSSSLRGDSGSGRDVASDAPGSPVDSPPSVDVPAEGGSITGPDARLDAVLDVPSEAAPDTRIDAGGDGPAIDGRPVDVTAPIPDGGSAYYSTNRAEFFGSPRCGTGLVLCDDFESRTVGGTPDPATWTLRTTANVTVAIDQTRAARGVKSMHFTTPNVPSEAYIRETRSFAGTGNVFYGRLFYFRPSPGPQSFAHWNIIEATGPQTIAGINMQSFYRYGGVSLGGVFNRYLFQFEHRPREPGYEEIGQEPPTNVIEPLGEWVCLEWFFDGDATEGRLWHDGVEQTALHATSPFHATSPQPHDVAYKMPVFDGLNLGWAHYQNPEIGFEAWIDEVAVDGKRIGCSR